MNKYDPDRLNRLLHNVQVLKDKNQPKETLKIKIFFYLQININAPTLFVYLVLYLRTATKIVF